MILIDTSVLSRVFRRRRPGPEQRALVRVFEELMEDDEPLGLPGIVLQETLSGISSERQFRELRSRLVGAFTIVPATAEDHVEAARVRNLCAAKGENVSGIDCLIAATALGGGHRLFAADADFTAIGRHAPLELFDRHPEGDG